MSEVLTKLNSISVGGKFRNFLIPVKTIVHIINTGNHQSKITDNKQRTYTYPKSANSFIKLFPNGNFISMNSHEVISLDYWVEETMESFDCKTIKLNGILYCFSATKIRRLKAIRLRLRKLKCKKCSTVNCLFTNLSASEVKAKVKRILLSKFKIKIKKDKNSVMRC